MVLLITQSFLCKQSVDPEIPTWTERQVVSATQELEIPVICSLL